MSIAVQASPSRYFILTSPKYVRDSHHHHHHSRYVAIEAIEYRVRGGLVNAILVFRHWSLTGLRLDVASCHKAGGSPAVDSHG